MNSQTEQILQHLQDGNSLTPLEALQKFGCFRLGARIFDLKQLGYNIETEMEIKGRKKYARYRLEVNKQLSLI